MSFKEYGNIVEPAKEPGQFKEFGEPVESLSRIRSLINAPAKGAVKRAGDIAGFVQSIAPSFIPKGPLTREKAHQFAEEKLPTFEKEPEKLLERGGGVATEALLSPGGPLTKGLQIVAGTLLGHAAEKFGAPEWAQSIAEGLPFFFSGGKKIPLKANQKKFGEFLRKEGLTEHEIAPLLKTPQQVERWSKWAHKGHKSKKLMESIYQKTGGIYDSIIEQGKNLPPLSEAAKAEMLTDLTKIWETIPNKFRNLIKKDVEDFVTKGRAGIEDIINLDRDINMTLGPESGGRAIIGLLKGPLNRGLESINPNLANDYRLAKQLYGTRAEVAGNILSRKELDAFMDAGEAFGLGAAVYNRDMGKIAALLGVAGGRRLATEMLINPKLQNISVRIGEALRKNKKTLALKYLTQFSNELSEDDNELSSQISSLIQKQE